MFCKYCGENLRDDSTAFCPRCGKRLIQNTNLDTENPIADTTTIQSDSLNNSNATTKPKSKKVAIIIVSILLACGILEGGIYGGYILHNKYTIHKYISYVKNNDYSSANQLYYSKLNTNNDYVTSVIQELNDYLYSIKDDMYNNNKSYEECITNLNTVNSLGIDYLSDSIVDTNNYLNEVDKNNSLITQADNSFDSGDYINAIKVYSMVNENTCEYNNVQDKISQAENLLVEQIEERSQELIEKQEYNKAIDAINEVSNILQNTSQLDSILNNIKDEYKQYFIDTSLENAKTSVSSKDDDTMVSYLETLYNGINLYENILDEKNVSEANDTILKGIRDRLNEYVKKSNVDKATTLLNNTLEILPEDQASYFDDVQSQIVNLIDEHSQTLISEDKDYSGALEYLQNIYISNPNNESIKKLYEDMYNKQSIFASVWNGTIATSKKDGVTLRESASKSSKNIAHIDDGKLVSVSAEFGEWYKVNYNGNDGYVLKEYVKNYG